MSFSLNPQKVLKEFKETDEDKKSWAQQLTSWIFGNQAEFYDSKFVGQGKNRDVTRVQTTGVVKVKINVLTHNMAKFGFSDGLADEPVAAAKAKGERGRSRGRSPRPGGRGRSRSPRPRSSKSPVRSKR